MKANELRIGNLLQGYSGQLFEITIDDLMIIEKGDSKAKPIPLTEEWLLNFGYIKNGSNYIIQGHSIFVCNDLLMCDKNGIVLKSVHQLQNLYFALTGGKELELNEK